MTKHSLKTSAFFLAALALQVGLLLYFQGLKHWEISHGRRLVVAIEPVDPSDVFRGDYVVFRFGFSRVPNTLLGGTPVTGAGRGHTAFLRLEPVAADWKPTAVAFKPWGTPAPPAVMLQGKINWRTDQELDLVFGCENYFVPQGRGRDLENALREHKLAAELSVTPSGQAYVTRLLKDGEPVMF